MVRRHRDPQPLSSYQDRCRDGVVIDHGLTLAAAGARSRVDNVALNAETSNFRIPALTRIVGSPRTAGTDSAVQRLTARAVADRLYIGPHGDGYSLDDWANPARPRLPQARATVIVNVHSPGMALVAGPLVNAVQGRLMLAEAGSFRQRIPDNFPVYLVGPTKELSRALAADLRRLGQPRRTPGGGRLSPLDRHSALGLPVDRQPRCGRRTWQPRRPAPQGLTRSRLWIGAL